jgi:hypothetical protein
VRREGSTSERLMQEKPGMSLGWAEVGNATERDYSKEVMYTNTARLPGFKSWLCSHTDRVTLDN